MQPLRFGIQFVTMKATHEFAAHEAIEQMKSLGFEVVGEHLDAKHTRQELQGAPVFRGLFGPFWAEGVYRYEDTEANEFYST